MDILKHIQHNIVVTFLVVSWFWILDVDYLLEIIDKALIMDYKGSSVLSEDLYRIKFDPDAALPTSSDSG